MRNFEEEFNLVGARVEVTNSDGSLRLGYGTYLWMSEILLDIGKKIDERGYTFKLAPAVSFMPLPVVLASDLSLLEFKDGLLARSHSVVPKGSEIVIESVARMPWNHGVYAAGRLVHAGQECWVLLSELELFEQQAPRQRVLN